MSAERFQRIVDLELEQRKIDWRSKTGEEKLRIVAEANAKVRHLMRSEIRQHHPEYTEAQIKRKMADWLIGEELAQEVYGPFKTDAFLAQEAHVLLEE